MLNQTMTKPQASLWINGRFVNLYSYKSIDKSEGEQIAKATAQLFLKKKTKAEVSSMKARLMVSYLVDPEDASVIYDMSDESLPHYFNLWAVDNG